MYMGNYSGHIHFEHPIPSEALNELQSVAVRLGVDAALSTTVIMVKSKSEDCLYGFLGAARQVAAEFNIRSKSVLGVHRCPGDTKCVGRYPKLSTYIVD